MKNIIIQGWPGVGKTTLVKKLISKLINMKVPLSGFYTEEVRDKFKNRIGFDVVTVDNDRGILARKCSSPDHWKHEFKVGKYDVNVADFERVALPEFEKVQTILIVDEIGQMESFSKVFQDIIDDKLKDKSIKLVATIPMKSSYELVHKIKNDPNNNLFTVNHNNRDQLSEEIVNYVL